MRPQRFLDEVASIVSVSCGRVEPRRRLDLGIGVRRTPSEAPVLTSGCRMAFGFRPSPWIWRRRVRNPTRPHLALLMKTHYRSSLRRRLKVVRRTAAQIFESSLVPRMLCRSGLMREQRVVKTVPGPSARMPHCDSNYPTGRTQKVFQYDA